MIANGLPYLHDYHNATGNRHFSFIHTSIVEVHHHCWCCYVPRQQLQAISSFQTFSGKPKNLNMKIMPFGRTGAGAGTGTSNGRIIDGTGTRHSSNKRVLNLRFLRRSSYKTVEKNGLHSTTSKSEVNKKDQCDQKGSTTSESVIFPVVDSPKETFLAVRERTMTLDTEATMSSPQSLNTLTPTSTITCPPCSSPEPPSQLVKDSTTPTSPEQDNVVWENENRENFTSDIDAFENDDHSMQQELVETPTKVTFKPNNAVLFDKTNTRVAFEPSPVSDGGCDVATNDYRYDPNHEKKTKDHQEVAVSKSVYFVEDQMLKRKKTMFSNSPPAVKPGDHLYAFDLPSGSSSIDSESNGSESDDSLNSSSSPVTKIKALLLNKFGLDWTDIQTDLFEIENHLVDYEKREDDNEETSIESDETSSKKVVNLHEGHQSTNGRLSIDNRSFDLSTIMEETDEEEEGSISFVSSRDVSLEKEIGDAFDLVGDKIILCDSHSSSEDSSDVQNDCHDDADEGKFLVSFVPSSEYINIFQNHGKEDVDSLQGSEISSLIDESLKNATGNEPIRTLPVVGGGNGKRQSRVLMMFYQHLQFVVFIGFFVITVVASNSTALDQFFESVLQVGRFINMNGIHSTDIDNTDDPTTTSWSTVVHWDLKHTLGLYSLLYGAWVALN